LLGEAGLTQKVKDEEFADAMKTAKRQDLKSMYGGKSVKSSPSLG